MQHWLEKEIGLKGVIAEDEFDQWRWNETNSIEMNPATWGEPQIWNLKKRKIATQDREIFTLEADRFIGQYLTFWISANMWISTLL